MNLYRIEIRSTRDFLHSALKPEAVMPASGPKKKPTRDDIMNAWKAIVHYDEVAMAPMIPAGAIERMLFDAAPFLGPKIGKLNFRTLIKSGLFVLDEKPIHFKGIRGSIDSLAKHKGCYIQEACYRNRITGACGLATRLAVRAPWEAELTIEALHEELTRELVGRLFEAGGAYVGLGAWRPRFGRFRLMKIETMKEIKAA